MFGRYFVCCSFLQDFYCIYLLISFPLTFLFYFFLISFSLLFPMHQTAPKFEQPNNKIFGIISIDLPQTILITIETHGKGVLTGVFCPLLCSHSFSFLFLFFFFCSDGVRGIFIQQQKQQSNFTQNRFFFLLIIFNENISSHSNFSEGHATSSSNKQRTFAKVGMA
jgi:hypothetical protein